MRLVLKSEAAGGVVVAVAVAAAMAVAAAAGAMAGAHWRIGGGGAWRRWC